MNRKLIAVIMAGIMVLSTGCSASVSIDPGSGVGSEDTADLYRIYVSDSEGNPVEGAMVQMCDDSSLLNHEYI